MRFEYTLEERSLLLGKVSDVAKFAHEQLRPADRLSLALDAAISDDDIIVVPKVVQSPNGQIFHVTSGSNIRTGADAINALDCKVKWGLAETPNKIPIILQPVDETVRAVPLGKVMTAEEICFSFPKSTTPAGWAAFGAKFPEEQRKAPHIVIWLDASGQFFYGYLDICDDERIVDVYPCRPGYGFDGRCCVLVRE
jgi:hypothetical protein